ncbi:hypothetical protein ACH5RR_034658 [Cinchona calisaya]|uniref:EamA domain-containing protein n=1 Tax=Cinchona calisaya TaxID=153742 RepID=A0ABD2YEM7_9GENT
MAIKLVRNSRMAYYFIPLVISYFHRRKTEGPNITTKLILMKYPIFLATAVIGLLTGLVDYLYAYGMERLPVSTFAIIIVSRLAFFAFLLVKQKFTAYSVNAVVLLMMGSGILALHTSTDRPEGCWKFSWLCFFGHCFLYCPDASKPQLSVWSAGLWQFLFLGAIGVISCTSSLFSGIMISALLPITEILAVIFFHEKFQAEKGVALVLSLFGDLFRTFMER